MHHPRTGWVWTIMILGLAFTVFLVPGLAETLGLRESRRFHNGERGPVPALKQMYTAQMIFQERVSLDRNMDGIGEFAGDFNEITGDSEALTPIARGVSQINMIPNPTDPWFSEKNGYIFRIFTSSDLGAYSSEADQKCFAVVAWPKQYDKTGNVCFAIDETGTIYRFANKNGRFDGPNKPVLLTDLYGTPFDPTTIGHGGAAFTSAK